MPATLETLIVLAFAIAPGFLAWFALSAHVPRTFLSDMHVVLILFLLSVAVHAVVSPFTIAVSDQIVSAWKDLENVKASGTVKIDLVVLVWMVTILLAAPLLIGWGLGKFRSAEKLQWILERLGLSQVQATPTAWYWYFLTNPKGCWVVAELDNGMLVGGEFGENSFASLTPHGRDIYLESSYEVSKDHVLGIRERIRLALG